MSFESPVSSLKRPRVAAAAIALLILGATAPLCAQGGAGQTLPLAARTKGSASAPVTVYEMADFQCPVCKRFVDSLWPSLEKRYVATGKVRWIFINYPIPSIHPNAVAAATFAVCAATQGKFWPAHDMLYGTQVSWEKLKDPAPFFQSKEAGLGLKVDVMNTCLQSGAGTSMVRDDAMGAEKAGANATPSFYIEGGMMAGLYPIEAFDRVLDSIYKAKTAAKGKQGPP